jgi:hypothetical protein
MHLVKLQDPEKISWNAKRVAKLLAPTGFKVICASLLDRNICASVRDRGSLTNGEDWDKRTWIFSNLRKEVSTNLHCFLVSSKSMSTPLEF